MELDNLSIVHEKLLHLNMMDKTTDHGIASHVVVSGTNGEAPSNLNATSYHESYLSYVLPYLSTPELFRVTVLNKEIEAFCEREWKARVAARFGALRYQASSYRRIYAMRCHFQRRVSSNVSARVYLMNTNGDTSFFPIDSSKPIMCSRERAAVYNRCERMFDLSLRINRSIQEISTLIGMVSLEEARDLLNEHINLMTAVAALRGSLVFESELFQVFPAPVLLDTNVLLRATHALGRRFCGEPLMMQIWVSIDNVVYRPLSIPLLLTPSPPSPSVQAVHATTVGDTGTTPALPVAPCCTTARFHELAGMTIDIDDNSMRYTLQPDSVTLNTLVSNAYLLYLFNPTSFHPLDWSYEARLTVGTQTHLLPTEREGVFLNNATSALRVFLSYGKLAQADESLNEGVPPTAAASSRQALNVPCDTGDSAFTFSIAATNRLTQTKKLVVSQAMRITLPPPTNRYGPHTAFL
ncbi:hypothetical protein, variant [Aphanomyces invadans]|uniref:F-box domain-containing protein n=1 Tax=Aphanomyces invadans TaxID=157072 RepID=A0A024UDY1_9STRA|nr:hypothetical protein, variant [Aphanomyces invadans]ETW04390.1 hypothetical protein, variant [Aphanomyces invadans]|eukprot:XP_008867346.1 hypothetical protein, variant [Aphanomyces invadans]